MLIATTPSTAAWWRQVFDVLDQALDLPAEGRELFVRRTCRGNPALGAEVARLLAHADRASVLDTPAAEFAAPFLHDLPPEADESASGARIGVYCIVRELGHGGMGTVYLAERADEQYHKTVALKVLRGWSAENDRSVRRFLEERQILAALEHPDIARLLDGGVTADGVPWFAMEYVEGMPIDRYCDTRGLSIDERLELFCRVCAAVQHAHRNLIVHRDLKPANILVTPAGGVKLLDFGIAKILSGDGVSGARTATVERLMTPLYASPEQVRGDAISTATDAYALGVLLNELLTGRAPYRLTTQEPLEIVRAILEQEPELPSAAVLRGDDLAERARARGLVAAKLVRRLRGDLDTIVLTALQKEVGRRYGTAEQVEADVRRHLAGLPVTARPDSRLYRTQKFVRRHRIGVGLAAGVALLVLTFAVVTAVQSVRIRAQAGRITVERDRAEQVSTFLAGLFQTSDPFAGGGATLSARQILDSGATRIDRELASQPEARAQMLFEMGRAYFGLGVRDRARRFVETSLAIRRRTSPEPRIEIAQSLDMLGAVLVAQGDLEGAARAYQDALALRRQLQGPRHRDVARTLNGLAGVLLAERRNRAAYSVSNQAVVIDEPHVGDSPLDLAESLEGRAHAEGGLAEFAAAAELYGRVLTLRRRALPEEHPEIAGSVVHLAAALGDAGQVVAADSLFRYGIAAARGSLGDDHPDVATDETEYARLLHRLRRDHEAERLYIHALTIARQRLRAPHPLVATILVGLGELRLDQGAPHAAESLFREALAIREAALPPLHPDIADAEQFLGAAVLARRQYVEAERYLFESHQGLSAAFGDRDPRTRRALERLVALYDAAGNRQLADEYRARLQAAAPFTLHTDSTPRLRGTQTRSGQPPESDAVAVLPFTVHGDHPALPDLRDWLQDLMVARLTGEGSPRAFDPHAVANALQRVGMPSVDASPDAQRRLRTSLGVGLLLRGSVAGTPDRLRVAATLGTEVATVSGSADSLPYLADQLTVRLLAARNAEGAEERAAYAATSLTALRAYLAGLEAYRRGRVHEAEDYFNRAEGLDSGFTPADIGVATVETNYWSWRAGDEQWRADAMWRRRHRMGTADRALLTAYLGPHYPRASTEAEMIAAAAEAARVAPDRVDAWYTAGDYLWSSGPVIGYPGWEEQSAAALRRAFRLDSTRALTLEDLIVLAALAGDRNAVRHYAALYLSHDTEDESADLVRWQIAVALDDSAALAGLRRRFDQMGPENLMGIVRWSQELGGNGLDDGDRAAQVLLRNAETQNEHKWATQQALRLLLNRGRPGNANRLLAQSDLGFYGWHVGRLEFRVYAGLYWDGDSSEAAAAARRLEDYASGAPAGSGEIVDRRTASCALAHWHVRARDFAAARAALARIGGLARVPEFFEPPAMALCVAEVEAMVADGRHSPNSSAALERLDSLLRTGWNYNDLLFPIGNLIAARLFEARGDLSRALGAVRRRAWFEPFLSTQQREEGRLAALNGDRAGAIRAYRHYLALRSAPEPGLGPEVERVRAELQRLEAGERR